MKNLQTIVASLFLSAAAMMTAEAQYSPILQQSKQPSPTTEYHRTYTGKDRFLVGDIITYVSAPVGQVTGKSSQSEKDYKRFVDRFKKPAESIMDDLNHGRLCQASDKISRLKSALKPEAQRNTPYGGFAKEYLQIVEGMKLVEFEFYKLEVGTTSRHITERTAVLAAERAPSATIATGLEIAIKPLDVLVASSLGRDVGKAAKLRSPDVYWKNVTEKEFHPESSQHVFDVNEYGLGHRVSSWRHVKIAVPEQNAANIKAVYLSGKSP